MPSEYARLSDAQARNLVIQSLRNARKAYRKADSAGERFEREIDRLITRKSRINAGSLQQLNALYRTYNALSDAVQVPLTDSNIAASNF